MPKKELLRVGQNVWLETINYYGRDVRYDQAPSEMIVLEANKSSAYIWHNDQSNVRYKVNQKTHQVHFAIPDGRLYRLWLSMEEYEQHVAYEKEMKKLQEEAHEKVNHMTLEELRSFLSS